MPYYSIWISGGKNPQEAFREAIENFRGHRPDFSAGTTFYIERSYDIDQLKRNTKYISDLGYTVHIKELTEDEFRGS